MLLIQGFTNDKVYLDFATERTSSTKSWQTEGLLASFARKKVAPGEKSKHCAFLQELVIM